MPNNYIQISVTPQLGRELFNIICQLANIRGRLEQLKLDADNMTDGVSYTTIETAFGIPTGKGQSVYNLLAGTLSDLNASVNMANLLNWVGSFR